MHTSTEPPEFYTTQECMSLFRMSHDAMCTAFKTKHIPAIKIGGKWLVHHTVIDNLIAQACGQPEQRPR